MQKKAKHKTNKKQNNYNIKKEEGYLVARHIDAKSKTIRVKYSPRKCDSNKFRPYVFFYKQKKSF